MSLLEQYDALLGRLRAELIAHYGPRLVSVAVFGSVGRGTPRYDSDVDVLASAVRSDVPRAADISKRLRRERELAFYGDIDFIPTEEYSADDGRRAYEEAAWVLDLAARVIGGLPGSSTA